MRMFCPSKGDEDQGKECTAKKENVLKRRSCERETMEVRFMHVFSLCSTGNAFVRFLTRRRRRKTWEAVNS
jgi:hypothetical protein